MFSFGGCAKQTFSGPLKSASGHANAHSLEHKLQRKHRVIRIGPQANASNTRCCWQWGRAIGITQPKWAADCTTRTLRRRIFCSHHQHGFGSASAKIVCLVNSSICSKVHGPAQILWVFAYHKCQVHWSGTCSCQRQRRQNIHIRRPTDADADSTAPTHEQHLDPFLDGPASPAADP